jgi:hypothetical protein
LRGSKFAPKGTRLPITPQWKLASTLRYAKNVGEAKVYGQVNATFKARRRPTCGLHGQCDGLAPALQPGQPRAGHRMGKYSLEFFMTNVADERGDLSRYIACSVCTSRTYIVPNQPRTFGRVWGQVLRKRDQTGASWPPSLSGPGGREGARRLPSRFFSRF